jgi:DHA2 family lincomycin resistance protein-like MFS transporter
VVPGSIAVSAVLWAMTFLDPTTQIPLILAGHFVFSIGLAFLFTPLFTSSLGAVKPELYSHGSAVLGSTQQVAGAAGVALFVALMSVQTATLIAGGVGQVDALAGGIRLALIVGAVLSMFAIVTAFFVRRPAHQMRVMSSGH